MAVLAFVLVLAAAAALVGAVLAPGDGFDLRLLALAAGGCLLAFAALSRAGRDGGGVGTGPGEDGDPQERERPAGPDAGGPAAPAWEADLARAADPAREAERRSEAAWRAREDS